METKSRRAPLLLPLAGSVFFLVYLGRELQGPSAGALTTGLLIALLGAIGSGVWLFAALRRR